MGTLIVIHAITALIPFLMIDLGLLWESQFGHYWFTGDSVPKSPFHKLPKLLEGSWNELRELSYTFFYKHNDHKHIEAKISLKTKHIALSGA